MLRRMNRQLKAAVCLILCMALLFPCAARADKSREQIIFEFLRDEMGFGDNANAIACGILANIYAETGGQNYDPTTYVSDVGGIAGGICCWYDSDSANGTKNLTRLKNYCASRGYQWDTLDGQLNFLKYELWESGNFNETRGRLMELENDMHGAWYAAYIFCRQYENPANRLERGIERGYYAENFWKKYVGPDARPVTSGDPSQSTLSVKLTKGPKENEIRDVSSCSLAGTVDSNYPITFIDCYVANAYGNKVSGCDFTPKGWNGQRWDGRHFDIHWDGADDNLPFASIKNSGSYFFCIDATDASGKTLAYRCLFHVKSRTAAAYTFYSSENVVSSTGTSSMGRNITLPTLANQPGFLFAGWLSNGTTYAAGESYKLLSPATSFLATWRVCPHRWDEGAVTAPTPEAGGYTTYTCLDCGATEQRDFTDPLPPSQIPGDLNGDYLLNEDDLHLLARHIAGIATLTDLSLADVSGDGNITAADLTALAGMVK